MIYMVCGIPIPALILLFTLKGRPKNVLPLYFLISDALLVLITVILQDFFFVGWSVAGRFVFGLAIGMVPVLGLFLLLIPFICENRKNLRRAKLKNPAKLRAGDRVKFVTLPPWVEKMPEQSQLVIKFCVGKNYLITKITRYGLCVLDVIGDVDHKFGGFKNDIRIEPEYLEKI